MIVKIKKLHPNAVIPKYALEGDAGLDLTVTEVKDANKYYEVKFGIAIQIPEGHLGFLCPRSNVTDQNLMLKNSVGVLDSNFRGEVRARFKKVKYEDGTQENYYNVGDRAVQLIILPYPYIKMMEVDELSDSNRGENGFGSTGISAK
jgi:dUTP pyrophosphatase